MRQNYLVHCKTDGLWKKSRRKLNGKADRRKLVGTTIKTLHPYVL